MNKKNLYINGLPIMIWVSLSGIIFLLNLFGAKEIGNFIGTGYIFLLFIVPLFYGVYNYFAANEIKEMFCLYIISLMSQLLGLALNGLLHYHFISSDSETMLVIQLYLVITLICTMIVDLIAVLTKMFVNKLRK